MSNIYLSYGNKSLPSENGNNIIIFNIPAIGLKNEQGKIDIDNPTICIESPEICRQVCYAKKTQTFRKQVYCHYEDNYFESKKEEFVTVMIQLIRKQVDVCSKNENVVVRIHESGDFYSIEYLDKWVKIANEFINYPNVYFMAYTKNIELLDRYLRQSEKTLSDINIKIRYSVMAFNETYKKKDNGREFESTREQSDKLVIANRLRSQGLTYYTLYGKDKNLDEEFGDEQICKLDKKGQTCAECEMKCYFTDIDIVAKVR